MFQCAKKIKGRINVSETAEKWVNLSYQANNCLNGITCYKMRKIN